MKQKAKILRTLACLAFIALPILFCVAMLALAAPPIPRDGLVLQLEAGVRQCTAQDTRPGLEYTVEMENKGDIALQEGQITHTGVDGRYIEGLNISGTGRYSGSATGPQGVELYGVSLRPGEALYINYTVAPVRRIGQNERIRAWGCTAGGVVFEQGIDVQTME